MKMRELEQRTGVSRQMVQFYLAHGLLPEPERPKPNVADYTEEHVRAIGVIRRLQTEGRLRIQEIKQALNGDSATVKGDVTVLPQLDELFALRAGVDTQLVSLASLQERDPKAKGDADVLRKLGAVEFVRKDGQVFLSRMDAQLVGTWAEMRAAGFTEDIGFDARIVAIYLKAATEMANTEVDIFLTRVPRAYPVEKRAAMADAASKLMLNVFTVLRKKAEVAAFRRGETSSKDRSEAARP